RHTPERQFHLDLRTFRLVGPSSIAEHGYQICADARIGYKVAMADEAVRLGDLDDVETAQNARLRNALGTDHVRIDATDAYQTPEQPAGCSKRLVVRRHVYGHVKFGGRNDHGGSR